MIDKLSAESSIYGVGAYLDYGLEDDALKRKAILLKIRGNQILKEQILSNRNLKN